MEKSDVSMGPLGASNTEGADAPVMLNTNVDEASLLNTATIVLSMPFKFPWLSRYGTVQIILKFAIQAIDACELFDGTKYKSLGATITELARITGGGKLKVDHTPALAKAVAIVVRSVVSATGGIFHPTIPAGDKYGAKRPLMDAINVFDILNGLGAYPSTPIPPFCVACRDCQMFVAKIIAAERIAGV